MVIELCQFFLERYSSGFRGSFRDSSSMLSSIMPAISDIATQREPTYAVLGITYLLFEEAKLYQAGKWKEEVKNR
jgi:hypothetical protein